MKKNNRRLSITTFSARLVACVCLCLCGGIVAAERAAALDLSYTAGAGRAGEGRVVLRLNGLDRGAMTRSVQRGLRIGIQLYLTEYQHAGGVVGLFGDRLLAETVVERVGTFDPFQRLYVVKTGRPQAGGAHGGPLFEQVEQFNDFADYLAQWVIDAYRPDPATDYVMVHVVVDYVRRSPMLGILSLFAPRTSWVTNKVRIDRALLTME